MSTSERAGSAGERGAIEVTLESRSRTKRRHTMIIAVGDARENSLFALKKAWQLNSWIVASKDVQL